MYSQGTTTAVAERDDLDARITAAFKDEPDDFYYELLARGVIAHTPRLLTPETTFAMGTGWVR